MAISTNIEFRINTVYFYRFNISFLNYSDTVACIVVSKQRLSKQVPAATDTHATIEVLLKRCFLFGPCKKVIRRTIEERIS
jgi:hypothetical protein